MAIAITPITLATGVDNPSKQISKNAWNNGHQLTATPNSLIGTDEYGEGVEYDIVGIQSFVTLEQFGGDPTGATYSDAAFTAALEAIGVTSGEVTGTGEILLGAGTYKFASKIVFELSQAQRNSFALRGRGPNISKMLWPNANGGIEIEIKGQENNVCISDLSLLTGQAGGGTALSITNSGAFGGGDGNDHHIERVYIAGDDKTSLHDSNLHGWDYGVTTTAVSNVSYYGVSIAGLGLAGTGTGITFQGNSVTSTFGVSCKILQCDFYGLDVGLIVGTWQQGLFVSHCNFTNGNTAIYQPGGTVFTDQLTVIGCQFNTENDQILLDGITHANIIGNLFFIITANTNAVSMQNGQQIVFQGNCVNGPATVLTGMRGLYCGANLSENAAIISGNTFYKLDVGVLLAVGTHGWNVQGNQYKSCNTHVSNLAGGSNSVGVATS